MKTVITLCLICILCFPSCNRNAKFNTYLLQSKTEYNDDYLLSFNLVNDSLFFCVKDYMVYDFSISYTFAYGKYVRSKNQLIFFDSISNLNYMFDRKSKDSYIGTNSVFKGLLLSGYNEVDANYEKDFTFWLSFFNKNRTNNQNWSKSKYMLNRIDTSFSMLKNITLQDVEGFVKIYLYSNHEYKILLDNVLLLRSGKYEIDKGIIIFNDSITQSQESAYILKITGKNDPFLFSINLPFSYEHPFYELAN